MVFFHGLLCYKVNIGVIYKKTDGLTFMEDQILFHFGLFPFIYSVTHLCNCDELLCLLYPFAWLSCCSFLYLLLCSNEVKLNRVSLKHFLENIM